MGKNPLGYLGHCPGGQKVEWGDGLKGEDADGSAGRCPQGRLLFDPVTGSQCRLDATQDGVHDSLGIPGV